MPVVVRDLPVLREVFAGTVAYAADVGELADALLSLLTGGAAPERRDAGRRLARSLTWATAASRHAQLYRDVVAGLT